ncbi:MAG: hypothetical protein JEY99_16370 [Spirochaetales bacterium]|nr:hypothetical protein [Spirochaetales bacterium]
MKNILIFLIIILPYFFLFSQTETEYSGHDDEWEVQVNSELDLLMTESNISTRTRLFLSQSCDFKLLSGSPDQAVAFLYNQALEMDKQFRRGIPGSRIRLEFKNAIEAHKQGRTFEYSVQRTGGNPFSSATGMGGGGGEIATPGKPESPGNGYDDNGSDESNGSGSQGNGS